MPKSPYPMILARSLPEFEERESQIHKSLSYLDEKIIEFKKSLSNLVTKQQNGVNLDDLNKDIESLN
jgi:hypothetical protein